MTQYTIFTSAANGEVAIWCISNINKHTDSIVIKQYNVIKTELPSKYGKIS